MLSLPLQPFQRASSTELNSQLSPAIHLESSFSVSANFVLGTPLSPTKAPQSSRPLKATALSPSILGTLSFPAQAPEISSSLSPNLGQAAESCNIAIRCLYRFWTVHPVAQDPRDRFLSLQNFGSLLILNASRDRFLCLHKAFILHSSWTLKEISFSVSAIIFSFDRLVATTDEISITCRHSSE